MTSTLLSVLCSGHPVLKLIAGIANTNLDEVTRLARTAEVCNVPALDVAAHADVIQAARAEFTGCLMASSVDVDALMAALEHGADALELGNFDALYDEGVFLDQQNVLALATDLMTRLAGRKVLVSVTVPGFLAQDTQVELAKALEALGVSVLQTEGAVRRLSAEGAVMDLTREEKVAITLSNTRALVGAVSIPVMSASGLTLENTADAIATGASMVGMGTVVRAITDESEQQAYVNAVQTALNNASTKATVLAS